MALGTGKLTFLEANTPQFRRTQCPNPGVELIPPLQNSTGSAWRPPWVSLALHPQPWQRKSSPLGTQLGCQCYTGRPSLRRLWRSHNRCPVGWATASNGAAPGSPQQAAHRNQPCVHRSMAPMTTLTAQQPATYHSLVTCFCWFLLTPPDQYFYSHMMNEKIEIQIGPKSQNWPEAKPEFKPRYASYRAHVSVHCLRHKWR